MNAFEKMLIKEIKSSEQPKGDTIVSDTISMLKLKYIPKEHNAKVVDIKHLWSNFYRLNFWYMTDDLFPVSNIVKSIFISAEMTLDGLVIDGVVEADYTKKG